MLTNKSTIISFVVILTLFLGGVILFNYQNNFLGATIASGFVQCDDTDNDRPVLGLKSEQAGTDSIFRKGGVRIKLNSYSDWSSLNLDSCSGNVLTETFCTSSARLNSKQVTCLNGCSDGKCNVPRCVDSDGPRAYEISGSTNGVMITDPDFLGVPPAEQDVKIYSDGCSSNLVLDEYYCDRGFVKKREILCSSFDARSICSEGRCVLKI